MSYRYLSFPGGKMKAVTFSYDDGVKADVRLSEIFSKYGMKATFNLNSAALLDENSTRLRPDDVKASIIDRGHEVAVHGAEHMASAMVSPTLCLKDAFECRRALEDTFDMIIRGMAYPDTGIRVPDNGNSYETVKNILTYSGIVYSRTLGGDNNRFEMPRDFHAWMPTAHHNNPSLFDWIDEFNSLEYSTVRTNRNAPRLMYIWGHSYEFDRDNNWERIEDICEKLSGREDTWYATNIEIYDYVRAYESLVFSADEKKVYNPTNKTVWLTCNYEIYKIEPDETVRIK